MSKKIINIAAYQFVNLTDLEALREKMTQELTSYGIMGTILLAAEGINLMLAGQADAIARTREYLTTYPQFADMVYKETWSAEIPFSKFRIKVKNEIVPMSLPQINPAEFTAETISAHELKQWLDEGRDFTLLDTRNDYEVYLGTFEKAIHCRIRNFRHFDEATDQLDPAMKDKPLVMFCTGGIRCEEASPLLINKGFKEVYQLEGGIIKYFQEVGAAHYRGNCFIFDHRTAITPACEETGLTQCERCQQFVTAEEQLRTNYQRGDHYIHCMPDVVAA